MRVTSPPRITRYPFCRSQVWASAETSDPRVFDPQNVQPLAFNVLVIYYFEIKITIRAGMIRKHRMEINRRLTNPHRYAVIVSLMENKGRKRKISTNLSLRELTTHIKKWSINFSNAS